MCSFPFLYLYVLLFHTYDKRDKMNIFLLSLLPSLSAKYHCDKHCVKMILETCQLLYFAHWINTIGIPKWDFSVCTFEPYKKTHINHPCSIWVRLQSSHYLWALRLGLELCKEYTQRYRKTHKCFTHFLRLKKMGFPKPGEHVKLLAKPEKKYKKATVEVPYGTDFFYCAINDEVFKECAVYIEGELAGVSTYRNYYFKKSWVLKWYKTPKGPEWYESKNQKKIEIEFID